MLLVQGLAAAVEQQTWAAIQDVAAVVIQNVAADAAMRLVAVRVVPP